MSSNSGESGMKYVVTLSQPTKRVCLKKVNIKDIPASALSQVIRCKQLSALQLGQETKRKSDEIELTVVSAPESSAASHESLDKEDSPPPKKIKMETASDVSDVPSVKHDVFENVEEEEEEEEFDEDDMYDEQVYATSEKQIKSHPRISLKEEDYDYVPLGNYKAKRTGTEMEKQRKVKPKLFRTEWLDIDIFRDWLDRDPTNPYKARCIACDSIMNAGKSELEKHAAGMKHTQALERMRQDMMMSQLEETNEDAQQRDDGSEEHNIPQPVMFGEDLQAELYHIRVQQVDALNRVATAVETLSATTVSVLEKMASTQESLVQIIQELQKK